MRRMARRVSRAGGPQPIRSDGACRPVEALARRVLESAVGKPWIFRDSDFESGFRSEKARGFESKRMEIELSVGSLDGNQGRESSQLQALHPWT